MEEKFDHPPSNNIVRENEVFGSTFLVLQFLCYSICYNYANLDGTHHKKNGLRGSSIYIAAAWVGEFQKWAYVSFPRTKIAFTPFFTGIPTHVMMMVEIETTKKTIANQTCAKSDGLKTELDKRNIGGDIY